MTDFPTVGLGVDLSAIGQGRKAYADLKKTIEDTRDAADKLGAKVEGVATKAKAANTGVAQSAKARAAAEAKGEADSARAAAVAVREKERQQRYLQQVRINSMKMQDAARNADRLLEAKAAADAIRQAQRVAKEQERLANQASRAQELAAQRAQRAQEKAAREAAAAVIRAEKDKSKAAEQAARLSTVADRKALAEAEKNAKYLQSVRINSIRMEEADKAKAAAAAQRAADRAAREALAQAKQLEKQELAAARALAAASRAGTGGRGGGVILPPGGGGGRGGPVDPEQINLVNRMSGALGLLRRGLTETRRLFLDVRTAVGVFLAGMLIKPVLDMADAMTALKARAAAFTDSSTDVPYLMEAIFQTAQRARTPLEAIATLYTRLAPLAKELGRSQLQLLRITETVAKGFQIGGATPEEARSASQQLAQALASNRLGGDELRSLAENAPILMAKIAQALNMNTGQFIKWAHDGKASAEVVIGAIEKAQKEIDRIFAAFPVTIGQSVSLVKNSLANFIGKVNEATGASQQIAGMISQFSRFLDSADNVKAATEAIKAMGVALKFLADTFQIVAAAWPAIAAILIAMGAARLSAIAKGWMAVSKSMLAFEAASVIAGRATAVLIVAQGALATAAAASVAALEGLVAMLGGPLGIALIAVAGAYSYFTAQQKAGDEALANGKTARQDNIAALDAAAAKAQGLGLNVDALNAAVAGYADTSKIATNATNQAAGAHDVAADAALARAQAEQALTATILTRRAAELDQDADKAARAAGARRVFNYAAALAGRRAYDPNQDAGAKALDDQVMKNREQAGQLRLLGTNLLNQPVKVTKPDKAGPANNPPAANNVKSPFEGALDQIGKMKAEVAGLQAQIDKLDANPLSALNEQIIQAGNEAAARLESGKKQNEALAAQQRSLAMDKERLTILKSLISESAANTAQITAESDTYKLHADAQQRATDVMKDYFGSGVDDMSTYLAALQRSREEITNADVAEAKLAIARRYGVDSLDQLKAALEQYGIANDANAQKLVTQAQAETNAAEAAIRRKAVLDAIASQSDDVKAFNEDSFAGAERVLQHMTTLSDNLGDSLASAFGRGGASLQRLLGIMSTYSEKQLAASKRVAEARAQFDKGGVRSVKSLQIEKEASDELAQARIEGYAEMASAAADFFGKGTVGYEVLKKAEMAFRLYEFAMSAKSIIVKAAETAAKIGFFGAQAQAAAAAGAANMFATLGPLGFAAVAAMAAVLAAFGLSVGGGGGGVPVSHREDRQKAQGAGTVLGDAAAKSDSIAKSLEIVASNSNTDLEFSNDMLSALRSIDENIGALTASLARQLNLGGFLSSDGLGLGTKTNASGLGGVFSGGIFGKPTIGLLSKIPVIGGIIKTLFGSKTTTSLQDAGLNFQSGSLSNILSGGVQGNTYQDLASQTKKKFFGLTYSNKTTYSTKTGDIDSGIRDEITRVIASLRDGVLSAASILGVTGAQAALDAMTIDLGKLSFKDMNGDEIEAALQAVFSKLGDDMATIALPMITSLQKAGEGALETLSRVARNYVVLDTALSSVGLTFGAIGVSSLAAREKLISLAGGIDELTGQISRYSQDFLTDAERVTPIITAVYTELGRLGAGSITTRDQFKQLVNSLDLTTDKGAATFATLMKLAPAFSAIVDYMDGLKVANDNVSAAQGALNDTYDTAAGLIQDVRDKFQAFLDSLKAFRQQLETGPLAANSPQDQYFKTKAIFESTAALAKTGDEKALANLQGVSEAFLQASMDYYAATEPYYRDLEAVKGAVDAAQAAAQAQVSAADQQLAALNLMVNGLVTVNNSVLTVAQAVEGVQAAIAALAVANASQAAALAAAVAAAAAAAAVGAAANQNIPAPTTVIPANNNQPSGGFTTTAGNFADYVARNSDLLAYYQQNSGGGLGDLSMAAYGQLQWQRFGQFEDRNVRPFAMGAAIEAGQIVDTPTTFDIGKLGEEGAEAIMPLVKTPDGSLGVQAVGGGGSNDNKELVIAVEGLTAQVKVGNMINRAGHVGTHEKLGHVAQELGDVKSQVRTSFG